jgi:3-keto-disaccharide hydrolase
MIRTATTLTLFLCPALVRGQILTDEEAKDGFLSLFNGKDISGWRFGPGSADPEKMPANWKVEDGCIKVSGGGSPHCASQWDFDDFDVRFEWRANKDKYNSGFYVRSGRAVGANQINLAQGGEGGIVGGKIAGARTVPNLQKKFGEWNAWRVLAIGEKITFWCNGELAWEGSDFKAARGYLGFQAEGAPIDFRNIRIKELGFEPLWSADKWAETKGWRWDGDRVVSEKRHMPLRMKRQDVRNYILRTEWKVPRESGIDISLSGKNGDNVVGVGEGRDGSGGVNRSKPSKKLDNPVGQWNYLELRVKDGKATVWLNGTVVSDNVALKTTEAGPLEIGGDEGAELRGLRIREIK